MSTIAFVQLIGTFSSLSGSKIQNNCLYVLSHITLWHMVSRVFPEGKNIVFNENLLVVILYDTRVSEVLFPSLKSD